MMRFAYPDHGGEVWRVSREEGVPVTGLLDFSANINPLGWSPRAKAAVRNALNLVSHYPDNDCAQLRRAVASCLGQIEPSNVFAGNGATEIIHLFSRAFIEEGSDAIVVQPTFSEYEYAILLNGGNPVHVYRTSDFELDVEVLLRSMTARTKAIYLCNPNNPTSVVDDREVIERIVQEAAKAGVMVLVDESFVDFVTDQSEVSFSRAACNYNNIVVLRSLTKAYGLAGLRVGYAVGQEAMVKELEEHKITWSVNVLAQVAANAALKDKQFLNKSCQLVRRERTFLEKSLRELGLQVTHPEANYLLARLTGQLDAHELQKRLLRRRILIRDCSRFRGLDAMFIRLAVKTRRENLTLLRAFKEELT